MIMKVKCLILAVFLLLSCCLPLASCSLSAYDVPEILNIEYKSGLYLDIYRPLTRVASNDPVVIYFHGGGWISGNRHEASDAFFPLVKALRDDGITVITADYTLLSDSVSNSYKDCVSDVIDCVDWVIENAKEFNIDTDNIGVMGYSAGAYLALMSAYAADAEEGIFDGIYGNISDKKIKLCATIAAPVSFSNDQNPGYYSDALDSYTRFLFNADSDTYYDDLYSASVINNIGTTDETTALRIYAFGNDNIVSSYHASDLYSAAFSAAINVKLLSFAGFDHNLMSYTGDPYIKEPVYTRDEILAKISEDIIEILK